MKKILITFLIFGLTASVFAAGAGVSSSVRNSSSSTSVYDLNTYDKSILHTNEGIKGNYEVIKAQNSTKKSGTSSSSTTNAKSLTSSSDTDTNSAASSVYKPASKYIPVVYGYSWTSNKNDDDNKTKVNVQNNTYNYYNSESSASSNTSSSSSTASSTKKTSSTQKSSASDIETEREQLKKKYANILSNKTMSNEKMCSKMESYFKNVSADELNRVLNLVLNLNCDIEKLRPDSVIR